MFLSSTPLKTWKTLGITKFSGVREKKHWLKSNCLSVFDRFVGLGHKGLLTLNKLFTYWDSKTNLNEKVTVSSLFQFWSTSFADESLYCATLSWVTVRICFAFLKARKLWKLLKLSRTGGPIIRDVVILWQQEEHGFKSVLHEFNCYF